LPRLPDYKIKEIEFLAREIGLFVGRQEPTPGPMDLAIIYGTLFSGLCTELSLDPEQTLRDLARHCEMKLMTKAEAEAAAKKEAN